MPSKILVDEGYDPADKQETEKASKIIREFAMVERSHIPPELFQTAYGGRLNDPKPLEIEYQFKGGSLEISAIRPLRPFDATLICLVACKAAQQRRILSPNPVTEHGRRLRDALELGEESCFKDCLTYTTSASKLMADLGLYCQPGGLKIQERLEESLKRIFKVSFILKRTINGQTQTDMFHMLSRIRMVTKGRDAKMMFAIDPIAAEAILNPGHYAQIDMADLRTLAHSPNQQLLYIQLCNQVDGGKRRAFTELQFRGLIYGAKDINNETPANIRQQIRRSKKQARDMMTNLKDWSMAEQDDLIWIDRPIIQGQGHRKKKKRNNS